MANAEIYNRELDRLKKDSLEQAHLRLGEELFRRLDARGAKVVQRVTKKLREPKPNQENINEDERLAIREATKRIDVTKSIGMMIDLFGRNVLKIRNKYYMETMREFAGPVWTKAGHPFVTINVQFSLREIATLPRIVNDNDIRTVLKNLKQRTLMTMNTTIQRAFRDVQKLKQDAKTIFIEQFRANMRTLQRQFRGILNDLLVSTFEVAKTRFTAAQRQFFEPQRA